MSLLEARSSTLALHYDLDRANEDEKYEQAVRQLMDIARNLVHGNEQVFEAISDNAGVIDLTFYREVPIRKLRTWAEWLETSFASSLES